MKRVALLLLMVPASAPRAQPTRHRRTENVILVTLDGMRWQEIFGAASPRSSGPPTPTGSLPATPASRRRALLPFLWDRVAVRGQLYGNRAYGNDVGVANYQRFSYPGYQEILSGAADPHVHSNSPVENLHPTVLDFLSQLPAYQGQVAAFASWAVLGPILHASTGHFAVNAGWQAATGPNLTPREEQLNALLTCCPRLRSQVRADTLTFAYALEYLKRKQPRVLYLSFGETDECAHEGYYQGYLAAAHQADQCLGRLWEYLQARAQYRRKTTVIITTDHGRGRGPWWPKHGLQVPGAGQTWLAVLGPDTPPTGEQRTPGHFRQSQVAQTMASLLGTVYPGPPQAGAPLRAMLPENLGTNDSLAR